MTESFDMSKINDKSQDLIKELEKYADSIRGELSYQDYMEHASALQMALDEFGEDDPAAVDIEPFLDDEPSSYVIELHDRLRQVLDHIKYLKQFTLADGDS